MRDVDISAPLLAWYDRHARALPWRVPPAGRAAGEKPDPYRVWLSEVMLQQTTVAAVKDYFHRFSTRWPTVANLAEAPDAEVMAEWAGLGYYARARNLLACARAVVGRFGGVFPARRDDLLTLPGVGPYTAAAIAAIAHDAPETVVDGNVERVIARLFAVEEALPKAKATITALAATQTPKLRAGDYAQAMMDLGATICTPRNPACGLCPLLVQCAGYVGGNPQVYPHKAPKSAKPVRQGKVWIAIAGDAVLVEDRPAKGLLGGMVGFVGDSWDGAGGAEPVAAPWQSAGAVRHSFTHFHLDLEILTAQLPAGTVIARGRWAKLNGFSRGALPSLMQKAWDVASTTLLPR